MIKHVVAAGIAIEFFKYSKNDEFKIFKILKFLKALKYWSKIFKNFIFLKIVNNEILNFFGIVLDPKNENILILIGPFTMITCLDYYSVLNLSYFICYLKMWYCISLKNTKNLFCCYKNF